MSCYLHADTISMKDIQKTTSFHYIIKKLLSIDDCYKDDTKHWIRFLIRNKLRLGIESIKKYDEYLEKSGYSASTINKRLIAVKNRFRYLFENSRDSFDIAKQFKLEQALKKIKLRKISDKSIYHDKIISYEEKEILKENANNKMGIIIEFLWASGLRISELTGIRLSDIKINNGVAYIRIQGKSKKERIIKVKTGLIEMAKYIFKGQKYLFETKNGNKYRRNYPSDMIKKYGRIYLGREISAHNMRHSFATEKIQETGKIKAVSKYLGHSSTSITLDMYVHQELSNDDLELK